MDSWKQSLDNISSSSLLIMTSDYSIIRFYCPIAATCIHTVAGLQENQRVLIDGVTSSRDEPLLYIINGLKLPHHYFYINN